jgi:nitrate/TMAO reductase-like tetraheme cytochrome c subunit
MKFKFSKKYYITISIILIIFIIYAKFIYSPTNFKVLDRYKDFNATDIPAGLSSLSSKECGECHIEIYDEWKTSMHAKAYTDPIFQAYYKKDNYLWVCLYCHTPLERQLEFTVSGFMRDNVARPILAINDDFDKELRNEGITCAACHVIDGIVHGPYDDADAPHPTKYDERFRTAAICENCHEVPKDTFMFYKSNPFGTIEEFNDSPYKEKGYVCQTCHMPEIFRPITGSSKKIRKTGRHDFLGGSSYEMLSKTLYIELEKKSGNFELRILNNRAGHKFPTGDPGRYVNIITNFYDEHSILIKTKIEKFERRILYRPIIIEFYDNRLGPLRERTYVYKGKDIADKAKSATVEVEYHILSDRAKDKLIKEYGLPKDTKTTYKLEPVKFTF